MTFKIAAICTAYYPLSHADVIVTRWLEPHPHDREAGFIPSTEIASLYVAQMSSHPITPDGSFVVSPGSRPPVYDPHTDIAALVAQTYNVPLLPSVRDALTLGGDSLAVDGVLLIGEHGDYGRNEFDQTLYPRKELFDEIIAVMQASDRVVPLFVDKHLSWNMEWANEMADTIRRMKIPFLGGSSVSLAGPERDLGIPRGTEIEASMGLFYLHPEIYGFHSLEFVQSIIEHRRGGESGIRAIHAFEGDQVWAAMERGVWSRALFDAALAATPASAGNYRDNCANGNRSPLAFHMEHVDGHCSTHVMLDGHIEDFVVALQLAPNEPIRASRAAVYTENTFVYTFAVLDREIERLFLTGTSSVPLERTLLTTLTTASWMHALRRPGERIPTPHLHLAYGGQADVVHRA